jgi:hypothetical protein
MTCKELGGIVDGTVVIMLLLVIMSVVNRCCIVYYSLNLFTASLPKLLSLPLG